MHLALNTFITANNHSINLKLLMFLFETTVAQSGMEWISRSYIEMRRDASITVLFSHWVEL